MGNRGKWKKEGTKMRKETNEKNCEWKENKNEKIRERNDEKIRKRDYEKIKNGRGSISAEEKIMNKRRK